MQIYVSVFSGYLNVQKRKKEEKKLLMGCTSVRDVGCLVCTALLSFYMGIQSASFPILSRGNVNKHVYCGGTFVACSSPQHQPKQCGEGGQKWGGTRIRAVPEDCCTRCTPGSLAQELLANSYQNRKLARVRNGYNTQRRTAHSPTSNP